MNLNCLVLVNLGLSAIERAEVFFNFDEAELFLALWGAAEGCFPSNLDTLLEVMVIDSLPFF